MHQLVSTYWLIKDHILHYAGVLVQFLIFCFLLLDSELISKGSNGVTLRDTDATNSKDGEWVKVNTLGHYKLDEMVRG